MYVPVVRTRKRMPSAGEFGVVPVKVPGLPTVLDVVVVVPSTTTMLAPSESSRASWKLTGVELRNGSQSKSRKIIDPAVAVNENMSTSAATERAPLAYVAGVA